MKQPFRVRRGRIDVKLPDEVLDVLEALPALLHGVDRDEAAAVRLAPRAHPDDAAAEERFRDLTAADLDRDRSGDRSGFAASVTAVRRGGLLEPESADVWLRVIGDTRLVLGARLGIEEDGWEHDADVEDPRLALLGYLGYLQEELVVALGAVYFGRD